MMKRSFNFLPPSSFHSSSAKKTRGKMKKCFQCGIIFPKDLHRKEREEDYGANDAEEERLKFNKSQGEKEWDL